MNHEHPLPAAERKPVVRPLSWQRLVPVCLAVAGSAAAQTSPPEPAVTDVARFFTSPRELRDELAVYQVLSRLYTGLQLNGQSDNKKQGSWANDSFLDVTGALRWVPWRFIEFSYEATFEVGRPRRDFVGAGCEYSQRCILQEAIVTVGNLAVTPWYVTLGHTEVPFGKYESHFRANPATRFLGETLASEVALGYDGDRLDLTFAAFEVNSGPRSWAADLTFSPMEDLDIGVFWTSNLTQSLEIKRVIQGALQPGPGIAAPGPGRTEVREVKGAGTFMSLHRGDYTIEFEYIGALDRFEPGLIADGSAKPWAWNLEAVRHLSDRWEIGARLGSSSSVPESPRRQYGVVTSFGINRYTAVSVEYLHNRFARASAQEQISAALLLRW
jgi:hypothetical protein